MMFYPLYIDPGTGSALFSIVIGAAAAVYFLFRALFIKLKVLITGGRAIRSAKNKFVIYAEDKRYWNLWKPILDEFEAKGESVLYLTSSDDDPVFKSAESLAHIKSEYIGEGNKAYARLNFLSADVLLSTTPGVDVFQWKRSKGVRHYCHILHAPTDAVFYRLFGLDYYDSVLLTGDYQAENIRTLEQMRQLKPKEMVTVGCPYLDGAAKKIEGLKSAARSNDNFTVLVSPSWGASSLLVRYGKTLLDPLIETGFNVIIRPHPQSKISENEVLEKLTSLYKNSSNVEWDYSSDNTSSLSKADIMISDFSGIIFDFMFLFDKPIIYVDYDFDVRPYDAHLLPPRKYWQTETLKKTGIKLLPADFKNIKNIITGASEDALLKRARDEAKQAAWMHQGKAAELTASFMMAKAAQVDSRGSPSKVPCPRP